MKPNLTILQVLLIAFLPLFLLSCIEKDNDEHEVDDPTEFILGEWDLHGIQREDGQGSWDWWGEDCDLEKIHEYRENGVYYIHLTENFCSGANTVEGTWKLSEDRKKIITTLKGNTVEYTIDAIGKDYMYLIHNSRMVSNPLIKQAFFKL